MEEKLKITIKTAKSQALSEYFLLLMLIAALTIIGTTTILPKVKTAGGYFFDKKIMEINGTVPLISE